MQFSRQLSTCAVLHLLANLAHLAWQIDSTEASGTAVGAAAGGDTSDAPREPAADSVLLADGGVAESPELVVAAGADSAAAGGDGATALGGLPPQATAAPARNTKPIQKRRCQIMCFP